MNDFRDDFFDEVKWHIEELLPYLYEDTDYEGVDFIRILTYVATEVPWDTQLTWENLYEDLYINELIKMWFIVKEWIINHRVLEKHISECTDTQLRIVYKNYKKKQSA